jgi:predicted alpha/beta-hydrolase family hydrolase
MHCSEVDETATGSANFWSGSNGAGLICPLLLGAGRRLSRVEVFEVESPSGSARVYLRAADAPRAWLLLGHGAGGGVEAPDLVAASEAALAEGLSVGLVEQPYRVAGRRSPAPAGQLDAAWLAVVCRLRERELRGVPLLVGGRSLGARVACRTVGLVDAVAVVCLAFPLQPPRRSGAAPAASRLPELDAVSVPTLVVQGTRDPFGIPPASRQRRVVEVAGDHGLKSDLPAVSAAVRSWLADLLARLESHPPVRCAAD